jgi:formylglycine-generating enzyme required for sulfatase activity
MSRYGWFADNSEGTLHGTRRKLPNAWGLFDMHGNAGEATADWVSEFPQGRFLDPKGIEAGQTRLARGGYYQQPAIRCTSDGGRPGYFEHGDPAWCNNVGGFRVVREIPRSTPEKR